MSTRFAARLRPSLRLAALCTSLSLSAALPLVAPSLEAQTAALGAVGGIVRDGSGAVVSGISVVITNTGTGASQTVTTDNEGFYQLQFLQPGTYEVILGGTGSFGKVDKKNVPVTVGAPISLDVVLPAASVTTEVTVTTDTPLVDTEKVEGSQVVDQNLVSNLPVASRRFESYVLLTPNVIPDGNTGLLGYRGISGVYNQNLVDGVNNNQQFFSEARGRSIGAPYVFPVESIQEFESSATGYSAELGGSAGGIINAITKSGTNQFHGDAYEYYRTPGLNALDPINKYNGRSNAANAPFLLTQPVKVQHQFGVSIGGPIIQDKLFFHFVYDGFRRVNPITYLSNYNTTGPGVANLVHLCDGGTTNLKDGTTVYPTSIPNITPAQCSAAVNAIQANLGAFQRNTRQDIIFPRIDYQLNEKTHISVEFLGEDYKQPNGYNTSTTVTGGGDSQNGTAAFHERFFIANVERVLTPKSADVVHFQWARDLETATTNSGGPANSLTNLAAYGETSALPRGKFPDEHKWEIGDVYSSAIGHHSLKAGFDLSLVHEQIANLFGGDGSFSYSNSNAEYNFANWIQDQLNVNPTAVTNGAAGSGIARHYASFSQTVDQLTGVGADDFWNQNAALFAEDNWKVTPKLLLSIGLRYDLQLVPGPNLPYPATTAMAAGYPAGALPLNPSPVAYNATSQINPDLHMIQPRFGFNYNPMPGTVIRGGAGMFYGQISNSSYYTTRRENGVYQKQYGASASNANVPYAACTPTNPTVLCYQNGPTAAVPTNGTYPTYTPQGGIPIYTPPGPTPVNVVTGSPITIPTSINPALAQGITIRGNDPSFTNPVSISADLTVEQQLPLQTTLSLGYVGNRADHLPVFIDTNVDPTSVLNNRFYHYTNPLTGAVGNYNQATYVNKLNAAVGSVATGFSALDSWYNSMVVTVHHPMSHGVELLANYTWAKAMDDGQTPGGNGTFNGTDAPIIPFFTGGRTGVGDEYSRSDLDIRSRLVITLLTKSNFKLGNRYAEYAANGWLLGGTYTAQSGEPVTATVSGTYSSIAGGVLGTPGLAITTDAGPANASFTSGATIRAPDFVAGRNAFKGPGVHNLDARLSRTFPIYHRFSFEVAAEAFNLANHRNILSVNTALVAYTAASTTGVCAFGSAAAGGCNGSLGPLSPSTAPFMSPLSTSNVIYGPRQVQLLGRIIF